MTQTRTWTLGSLAIAAIVVGFLFFYGDRDVRAIRVQLNALVETVEKDGTLSKFELLGRSRKFKDIFFDGAHIQYLPGKSLPTRAVALQSGFLSVWSQIKTASVRISQHEVEVDSAGTEACSTFYANCKLMMNGSNRISETVFYRAYWVKIEGDWLIESITAENYR